MIRHAPITHANLRLAHILIRGAISNIVVTPNFDDLLSRALTLFGYQHIICDDPRTVERIDPEKPEIQLIHVHGSYWFYDVRNTRSEIHDRALPDADTTLTMAALLDKIMAYRAPLVIGYSGWENDVFMTALKRRLLTPLPYNLYWFCFQRSLLSQLPDFLNHPDVYLIVPPQDLLAGLNRETDAEEHATENAVAVATSEPELTATAVFDAFIRKMQIETPRLTNDPLSFFVEQLSGSIPKEEAIGRDIYAFRSVIERVERAKQREVAEARTIEKNESQLEVIREAVRGARYDDAATAARDVDIYSLTDGQIEELMGTMQSVAAALLDVSPHKAAVCDLIINCFSVLNRRERTPPMVTLLAASNRKGNVFYAAKEWNDAIRAYDFGISRCGEMPTSAVQVEWARLKINKGLALRMLQKNEESVAAHSELIDRLGGMKDELVENQVVAALTCKGTTLYTMQRYEEASDAFSGAIARASNLKTLEPYSKAQLTVIDPMQKVASTLAAALKLKRETEEAVKEQTRKEQVLKDQALTVEPLNGESPKEASGSSPEIESVSK